MRLHIASDVLMTSTDEQESNVRWLGDLLRRPLGRATGIIPLTTISGQQREHAFSRRRFFESSNVKLDSEARQFFYAAHEIDDASVEYLRSAFDPTDVILGYELSEQTRTILTRAGLRFIDIWLHPVRFTDDILFGLASNHPEVDSKLGEHEVDEYMCFAHADRLRVQNYRGFRRFKGRLEDGAALFVGQTLLDKAVFCDGRMLNLLDFESEFRQLGREHSTVYYSRHPFVKHGDEAILDLIRSSSFAQLIDFPTYHLLASDEIRTVASISSSVVQEAKYFGKATKHLYRPPVPLRWDQPDGYATIGSDLLNPAFWSRVLAPAMQTDPDAPEYRPSATKDRLRDALSFYWGYRAVDKTETLRENIGRLHAAKPANNVSPRTPSSDSTPSTLRLGPRTKMVSFDVFDTLLERSCASPKDVFGLMESEATELSGGKIREFRKLRVLAEKTAIDAAAREEREDTDLNAIYAELRSLANLSLQEEQAIKNCELEVESEVLKVRDAGKKLYEEAVRAGLHIVLVSDMYLPSAFIEQRLEDAGYRSHTTLYLSSELGVTKREGGLFAHVLRAERLRPEEVLHIGDNPLGDVEVPKRLGLKTQHLPRAMSILRDDETRDALVRSSSRRAASVHDSMLLGLYAKRFYSDPALSHQSGSLFDGDPFQLGYGGLGPSIVGFTTWLHRQVRRDGIERLVFLARDARICKSVYDTLFGGSPDACETQYALASRRSAWGATLYCRADLATMLTHPVRSTTLGDWLGSRFALKPADLDLEAIRSAGFPSEFHKIGDKTDRNALEQVVLAHEARILERSRMERELLREYYEGLAPDDGRKWAIVDLGYAGSMQRALQRILGRDVGGYYYATFKTASVELRSQVFRGFVGDRIPPSGVGHPICQHRFLMETFFCAPEPSFLHFERGSEGRVEARFSDVVEDERRRRVVRSIQEGALALARDVRTHYPSYLRDLDLDAYGSIAWLDDMLRRPNPVDAAILEGVVFEDSVGGTEKRYVLAPHGSNAQSIWQQAAAARAESQQLALSSSRWQAVAGRVLVKAEQQVVARLQGKKKAKKLKRGRELFFRDSKHRAARIYEELTRDLTRQVTRD